MVELEEKIVSEAKEVILLVTPKVGKEFSTDCAYATITTIPEGLKDQLTRKDKNSLLTPDKKNKYKIGRKNQISLGYFRLGNAENTGNSLRLTFQKVNGLENTVVEETEQPIVTNNVEETSYTENKKVKPGYEEKETKPGYEENKEVEEEIEQDINEIILVYPIDSYEGERSGLKLGRWEDIKTDVENPKFTLVDFMLLDPSKNKNDYFWQGIQLSVGRFKFEDDFGKEGKRYVVYKKVA
jgi:hypothetical protein